MTRSLRSTVEWFFAGLVMVGIIAEMFFGLSIVSDYKNDQYQASCQAQGGEFYRAGWSGRSLCKVFK